MPIATHDNGSFWFDSLESLPEPEKPSSLPRATDVAIIGAGFTGLWTAYYLKQRRPDLSIAIFEAVTVGYGASGRNGGWCMGGWMPPPLTLHPFHTWIHPTAHHRCNNIAIHQPHNLCMH
jgi:hypothetical protein